MSRLLAILLVFSALPSSADSPVPVAQGLVPFADGESVRRLERSKHKTDFFILANHFEGQINSAFCGPATATIVLNALRADNAKIDKPRDTSTIPERFARGIPSNFDPYFRRYTQRTFFDEGTERVKPQAVFFGRPPAKGKPQDGGLQLRQLHEMLLTKGLKSELRVVGAEVESSAVRAELKENLARGGDFVIINYHRQPLGQTGGGHISPLGAYDEASDAFLIMDVNPNGRQWVWVPTEKLVEAMRTPDRSEHRGYLLVRDSE